MTANVQRTEATCSSSPHPSLKRLHAEHSAAGTPSSGCGCVVTSACSSPGTHTDTTHTHTQRDDADEEQKIILKIGQLADKVKEKSTQVDSFAKEVKTLDLEYALFNGCFQ